MINGLQWSLSIVPTNSHKYILPPASKNRLSSILKPAKHVSTAIEY